MAHPGEWAGETPAVLVAEAPDAEARRELLASLAAEILGRRRSAVEILHRDGHQPRLVRPDGSELRLSSASRAGMAALAVGREPLGIDIEAAEPGREPPWEVLHPDERAWLHSLAPGERPGGFARTWAAKEAYVKALGTGFGREPTSFAVSLDTPRGAEVTDPAHPGRPVTLVMTSFSRSGRDYALALVMLPAKTAMTRRAIISD